MDPVALRRRIGYVIQQIGPFPHMTIAQDVALVPRLPGWDLRNLSYRVEVKGCWPQQRWRLMMHGHD